MITFITKLRKLGHETYLILLLLLLAAIPRFVQLGYSHYYGDETKTLYLDKTVTAFRFLMSQRKGPVQFMVVWLMEKLTGGFDEFWIRLPFALAGLLSVLFFYLYLKKLYGFKTAILSSFVYAFSGFNIAFSRTAQYQSFLMLFGFSALYLFELYSTTGKKAYLLLSALAFSGAFLAHYDAIFFVLPLTYSYGRKFITSQDYRKLLFFWFILPIIVLCSLFYIPYIARGAFLIDTVNYLSKRFVGRDYLPNNSLYTISIYNPGQIFIVMLLAGLIAALLSKDATLRKLFNWFFIVFVIFEFVFQNPGTHIQNYLIPLYIAFGYFTASRWNTARLKNIPLFITVVFSYSLLFLISLWTYLPVFNTGYPWTTAKLGFIKIDRPAPKYQLFLYGFPYNVGWDQIRNYMVTLKGVRGYHTNDDDTLGYYYLKTIPLTLPGDNFLPQYYIDVTNPMETQYKSGFLQIYASKYTSLRKFYVNGVKTAEVYKIDPLLYQRLMEPIRLKTAN